MLNSLLYQIGGAQKIQMVTTINKNEVATGCGKFGHFQLASNSSTHFVVHNAGLCFTSGSNKEASESALRRKALNEAMQSIVDGPALLITGHTETVIHWGHQLNSWILPMEIMMAINAGQPQTIGV